MPTNIATDGNFLSDEKTEFPILCETCLGPNPYVRMTRAEVDKECKICARPFTNFRWRPGRDARYKTTQVCQTCAKLKNVCQTCIFDMEHGLPVQVRDTFTPSAEVVAVPQSEVNREWFVQQQEKKFKEGEQASLLGAMRGMPGAPGHQTLTKLARVTPYYKRNRSHICSFYVKGECNRGEECPYRHEMPQTGELSHQNIKDRFYGVNDPVAKKILRIHEEHEARRNGGDSKDGPRPSGSAGPGTSSSSTRPSIPLPDGPAPATYYTPAPAPGSIPLANAYASQKDHWVGSKPIGNAEY